MNKTQLLEQLIAELCPEGVEWKKLGEVGLFYGGLTGKSKHDFSNGNAPFITYMNVFCNPAIDLSKVEMVKVGEKEKQNSVKYGDVIFTGSSETPNEAGMTSVLAENIDYKLYLNSFCFGFRFNNVNIIYPHFIKHLFRAKEIRKSIIKTANGVTRFNVSKKLLADVEIPIPPLDIQTRVAEILDNFTALTAELQARQQQYEYYRNRLLSFGGLANTHSEDSDTQTLTPPHYKTLKMSEMCTKALTYRWKGDEERFYIDLTAVDMKKHSIEYVSSINATNAPSRAKQLIKTNDIIFATTRPTQLRSCIVPPDYDGHICSTGYCVISLNTSIILPKWIYYHINTPRFLKYVEANETKGGSYPAISDKLVKEFEIPIPPLPEQQRIVDILDRFEALTSDLSSGLPAEIKARQQQYEYYRNKLLSFKRLA